MTDEAFMVAFFVIGIGLGIAIMLGWQLLQKESYEHMDEKLCEILDSRFSFIKMDDETLEEIIELKKKGHGIEATKLLFKAMREGEVRND